MPAPLPETSSLDASRLRREQCSSCADVAPLDEQQLEHLALSLSAWSVTSATLHRRYEFADFASAFAATARVALVAETQGHHPDLRLGWGYLDVELRTHASNDRVTRNDAIVAAQIEHILG